ncbi:ABC transporter ATP-binding protein [Halosegnis marinus]|uniref:ABC transporter ATP-binding protein n=1 Tax=Halosegnis marinus TaxID=3034023 RepID=UPI00360FA205
MKAVGGILPAAAGRVTIDGRDVAGMSARETARLVASVPQDSSFDFDFTVREVVEMGRTPYRKRLRRNPDPDGPDRVAAALDRTDTAGFADRSVASLSGGEKQRVLLARALAQDAPALLLDEPTASLDINHQVRTLDLVAGLDETVVAAVHDLDLAARYCDRVALLAGAGSARPARLRRCSRPTAWRGSSGSASPSARTRRPGPPRSRLFPTGTRAKGYNHRRTPYRVW